MPGVKAYVRSDDPLTATSDAREVEEAFKKELTARRRVNKTSWEYYDGLHVKHLVDDASDTDDNLTFNLVGLSVDKSVASMYAVSNEGLVEGVTFDVVDEKGEKGFDEDAAADDDKDAQKYLDDVLEANLKDVLLTDGAQMGSVTGHTFMKIRPDAAVSPTTGEDIPRITLLDTDIVTVFWDEADKARVLWYRIQFGKEGKRVREDYVRDVGDDGEDAGSWTVYVYDEKVNEWKLRGEPLVWDYSWAPIVDWKNLSNSRRYYGKRDVTSAAKLNDGVNFVLSNVQRIIKHHAHPTNVLIGAAAKDLEATSVDRLWALPKDATVEKLELQSDLSASLNFASVVRRGFFDETRQVDPATTADKLGDITNFAMRVLYGDEQDKTGMKRILASPALRALAMHVLELGGFDNVRVNVLWSDSLPQSDVEQATALTMDRAQGASRETYLTRRKYDADQEQALRDKEREEKLEDALVLAQNSLSERVMTLGNLGADVLGGPSVV